MKYILIEKPSSQFDAGPKARQDVAFICQKNGYDVIQIFQRNSGKFKRCLELIYSLSKLVLKLSEGDIVIIQYPYQPYIIKLIYNILRRRKGVNITLLLHDVFYLWDSSVLSGNQNSVCDNEIELFNQADNLIVHNEKMYMELKSKGVRTNMKILELFDYIYSGKTADTHSTQKCLVFAGNISKTKSGFLYHGYSPKTYNLNLYGNPPMKGEYHNIKYKGSFSPDELIKNIKGNFGLVWDGDSENECTGVYGNYLKYNNPHKLSMYLAAGLPVIVWNKSALSEFVSKNGIGISISSLHELNDLMSGLDPEEYKIIKHNVDVVSQKLTKGYFLSKVLQEIG